MPNPIDQLIQQAVPWLPDAGPGGGIVVSTRVRLARNLADSPFPARATVAQRRAIMSLVEELAPQLLGVDSVVRAEMGECDDIDRLVLLERRLASRELCGSGPGSGVLCTRDETASVMVNEEDHIRIQCTLPGLHLAEAWQSADRADTALSRHRAVAFDPGLGFLTACPTNVGTGMRASVMLQLPALTLSSHMEGVARAAARMGLTVRGLHGEGSQATGFLYQVSNQSTLGESEEEIVTRLERVVRQVIWHERNARLRLVRHRPERIYDYVGRAYGAVVYARILSSTEATDNLCALRAGIDLELFTGLSMQAVNQLILLTQPGHLQKLAGRPMTDEQRDVFRTEVVRSHLDAGRLRAD